MPDFPESDHERTWTTPPPKIERISDLERLSDYFKDDPSTLDTLLKYKGTDPTLEISLASYIDENPEKRLPFVREQAARGESFDALRFKALEHLEQFFGKDSSTVTGLAQQEANEYFLSDLKEAEIPKLKGLDELSHYWKPDSKEYKRLAASEVVDLEDLADSIKQSPEIAALVEKEIKEGATDGRLNSYRLRAVSHLSSIYGAESDTLNRLLRYDDEGNLELVGLSEFVRNGGDRAASLLKKTASAVSTESCEQPRKVAGVKARKIAEGERLRMIKSSG